MQTQHVNIPVNPIAPSSERPSLRQRIFMQWQPTRNFSLRYVWLAYTTGALSLLFCVACLDLRPADTLHTLDYLAFYEPSGWHLHIEGDGSGRLQHRDFSGRVLFYPSATFQLHPLPAHFQRCCQALGQLGAEDCAKAIFYSEENNQKSSCLCPSAIWMQQFFYHAFLQIDKAEGGSRDRRLLEREWLQNPPFNSD